MNVSTEIDEVLDLSALAACPQLLETRARDGLGEVRSRLDEFLVAHHDGAPPCLTAALHRLGFLTELWECLAPEDPLGAAEIVDFLTQGIAKIAANQGRGELEAAIDDLLRITEQKWGHYLLLLETGPGPVTAEPAPDDTAPDDEPCEPIDASELIRLLCSRRSQDDTSAGPSVETDDSPLHEDELPSNGTEREDVPQHAPDSENLLEGLDLPPELWSTFLAEAAELYERIELSVLEIERGPANDDVLPNLARALHTVKGTAGSVGLKKLATCIHELEDRLRASDNRITNDLLGAVHEALGTMDATLRALAQRDPNSNAGSTAQDAAPSPESGPNASTESHASAARAENPSGGDVTGGFVRVSTAQLELMLDLVSELLSWRGSLAAQLLELKEIRTTARLGHQRLLKTLELVKGPRGQNLAALTGSFSTADFPLGPILSELAGDFALVAESVHSVSTCMADEVNALSRLSLQLWDAIQAVRIVPVQGLFRKLERVAREAALTENRRITFETQGDDVGVDRTIVERVFEPLLHLVRNAVGHGLEPPEQRVAVGKPAEGRISIEARQEDHQLVLALSDDGRGLDDDAIAAKARRLGLLLPDEKVSQERLHSLIFQPGFSTREQTSTIAGRGVGMDVVAREVSKLRGTVDLETRPGQGARFTLRIPARVALERVLVFRVAGDLYAFPLAQIEHASALDGDTDGPGEPRGMVQDRGNEIPLIDVRPVLGQRLIEPSRVLMILIAQVEGELLALPVDQIEGPREVVVRPLGPLLAGHPFLRGTSLLATGETLLVLHLPSLVRLCRTSLGPIAPAPIVRQEHGARILVVDDSISVRKVTARHLKSLGFGVVEASDGLDALNKLRSGTFALIATDLEMPRMGGIELLMELKHQAILPDVPIVVITSQSDPQTQSRVTELGARALISKPAEREDLERVVLPLLPIAETSAAHSPPLPQMERQSWSTCSS